MNREQELTVRRWLESRDPEAPRPALRERVRAVPLATPPARFPGLDLTLRSGFGLAPIARPLLIAAVVLLAVVTLVGALLFQPWRPFPPRGLIAYAVPLSTTGASGIVLSAADGTGRRQVTPDEPNIIDQSPRWSADGRSLVFSRTSDLDAFSSCLGVGSIVLYDVASGSERILASDLRPVGLVEWSPSGNQAAFVSPDPGCGAGVHLGIVDLETGKVTTTLVAPQESEAAAVPGGFRWHIAWDGGTAVAIPDEMTTVNGQDFTFSIDVRSHRGGGVVRYAWSTPERIPNITAIDVTTGASTALGIGGRPAWSPDDRGVAFIRAGGPAGPDAVNFLRDQLVIVSTDTWQARPIVDVLVMDGQPADWIPDVSWTADGGAIYWLNRSGGVQVVDVVTGRSAILDAIPDSCNDIQWQPLPTG